MRFRITTSPELPESQLKVLVAKLYAKVPDMIQFGVSTFGADDEDFARLQEIVAKSNSVNNRQILITVLGRTDDDDDEAQG